MANHYDIPKWAGKPPVGTHLDVMKEDKLVQKLMLDEKKCYLFGRNPQMNDFCTDHQSCSRVHAAFVYHKHLQRAFLVDLGSTHGTFIGSLRLEANKPTQLPPNSSFHFGASTRHYIMRERPQGNTRNVIEQLERGEHLSNTGAAMLGLTEATADLDNLTEFNTAHNRRISMLGIGDEAENPPTRSKKKRKCITFSEEQELINPEDVDPSVGRFRNMVHSTVIPGKKQRYDPGLAPITSPTLKDVGHRPVHPQAVNLYSDLPHPHAEGDKGSNPILSSVLASRLGIALPDPAPEVDMADTAHEAQRLRSEVAPGERTHEDQPSKKKIYAKEAWPGKKPLAPLLLVSSAPPTNFL